MHMYLGVTNAAELGISRKIYVKYCTQRSIGWSCHLIRTMTWCYRGAPILRIRAQELIGLKLVLISSHTCSCRLVCASLLSNIPTAIASIACHTGPDFNFNGSLSPFWELFNALRRINFQNVWNLIGGICGFVNWAPWLCLYMWAYLALYQWKQTQLNNIFYFYVFYFAGKLILKTRPAIKIYLVKRDYYRKTVCRFRQIKWNKSPVWVPCT